MSRWDTSTEMKERHARLVRDGFIEVVTLPGGGSQLQFPRGENSEEVREYLRHVKDNARHRG